MSTECLLCLELNKDELNCIKVDSSAWNELHVKVVIEKHLWPMVTFKTKSLWLCISCWQELYDFHKFYKRIENAQLGYEGLLKTESDVPAVPPEDKTTDILSEILIEPEIVIEQAVVDIKEEHEDTDSDNGNKDGDDIPLIHLRSSIDIPLDDPMKDSDNSLEDPLDKPPRTGKTRVKRKRLRKIAVKPEAPSIQTAPETEDDEDKEGSDTDDDMHKEEGKNSNNSWSSSDNKIISCRKSYYQPRTNRQEHDKFLAQHFKLNCNVCQESFETFPILLKHFGKVHKERGYVICCEGKFYDRSKLVDHINYHLNPEYFKCKHCPKVLSQRKSLRAHMKLHEEKQHSCDICNKKFVRKCKLDLHKLTHMSEEEKKFPCAECGKFFASEAVLSHHQTVVHLNKYAKLCDICGQSMRDLETFRRHMEKHEGIQSTTYSCDICGLVVAGKRNLKLHMNSQHPEGGKKEYTCHICSKISPTLNALRKHIRCTHEMGYNYKCTICEKAFKRPDNLKAHMATHTGNDLYKCPWCPKTFNSNGNMHNHRKKIHPKEWEEARRKRYSGKLPPNFKPPSTADNANSNFPIALDY